MSSEPPSVPPSVPPSSPPSSPPSPARARRPLAFAAWGLLLVGLDLKVNGFDLLPDVVGWVLVLVAAVWLAGAVPLVAAPFPAAPSGGLAPDVRERGRRRLAVATAVLALVPALLPLPFVGLAGPLDTLAPLVAVALLLRLVSVQAELGGDPVSATRWQRLFLLWSVASAVLVADDLLPGLPPLTLGDTFPPSDAVVGAGVVAVAVILVAVLTLLVTGVVVIVRLFRDSRQPWAVLVPRGAQGLVPPGAVPPAREAQR